MEANPEHINLFLNSIKNRFRNTAAFPKQKNNNDADTGAVKQSPVEGIRIRNDNIVYKTIVNSNNIDPKGRVTMPSRFREDLGDAFYVTKGLDGCLFVLSSAQWDKLTEKMGQLPISKARSLQRFFFSGAFFTEVDKQGRILIPPPLREYAGLNKEVTILGAATRAEIWDSSRWNAYNEEQTQENLLSAMELLEI